MRDALEEAKGESALLGTGERGEQPKLKELVVEASRALARLDADRLEELALSCQALNRDLATRDRAACAALALQAQEAAGDMAVFAKVLEATRANLGVMNRLRELRMGRLEYNAGHFDSGAPQALRWSRSESRHGNN
jgi:aminopeptidase N